MKRLLTLAIIGLLPFFSHAQGNFIFSAPAGAVWDGWSSSKPKLSNTNYVAFLIGSGASLVGETVAQQTPTNSQSELNFSAAWTAILNDPNYHFATNAGTGTLVVQQVSTLGAIAYFAGSAFTVAGTSSSGGSISIFVIGWSVLAGANPYAAAASGSVLGWSSEFTYNYAAGPNPGPAGTPGNMGNLFHFGVGVPEPTSFALIALGGVYILAFRRRN